MNVYGILSSKIDKYEYEIKTLTSLPPDKRKASLFIGLKYGNPHEPVCKRRPKKNYFPFWKLKAGQPVLYQEALD